MHRCAALLSLVLGALVAVAALTSDARAEPPRPEIVLAQNDGFNIFRFLFRPPREVAPPWAPPVLEPRKTPQAARPRRERRARTAAPTPREIAAVEKADNAKRVLVIGDFMAGALAKGLAEAYSQDPNVVVIDANSGSSGLVRNDYYDWPAKLAELVTEQKPDAILAMIGANDRQTMRTESGSFALGSDTWRTTYAARVAALADALKATGKPGLWVGLTPVRSSAMSRDYSFFNGIVREQLEGKGLPFIETWNGFADEDGKYVGVGPDIRGQSVQLRASDGLNFTRAGQRKLAYFVEQPLGDMLQGIVSPLVAAVDPNAAGSLGPDAAIPAISPMVPLDALGAAAGDALSAAPGNPEESGATAISERLAGKLDAAAPIGRADHFGWPPPEPGSAAVRATDIVEGPRPPN
jgi:hypothetical protein